MEVKAKFTYVRRGPRKLRLAVDMVRGKKIQDAVDILTFDRTQSSKDVLKLIRSAVANAATKGGINLDSLYVKQISVDQASIMKRFTPRAKGSASPIQKKLSHVSVVLDVR